MKGVWRGGVPHEAKKGVATLPCYSTVEPPPPPQQSPHPTNDATSPHNDNPSTWLAGPARLRGQITLAYRKSSGQARRAAFPSCVVDEPMPFHTRPPMIQRLSIIHVISTFLVTPFIRLSAHGAWELNLVKSPGLIDLLRWLRILLISGCV